MRSDRWQVRFHGTLERLNSTLVWIGVTVFYLILVWLDLRHVEEARVLRLILSLRGVFLLFAGWHGLAVLMAGNRQVLNAVKWAIVFTHLLLQLVMGVAYEPSHIVQIVIPLPTILLVYFVVPATPRLKVTAGVGQTLLSSAMAVGGLGISRDAALILIPTMVLLNAVGIAHMRTHAYLNRIRRARESEIEEAVRFSRLLSNVSSTAAAVVADGRIVDCTKEFTRLTGWSYVGLIGRFPEEVFARPEDFGVPGDDRRVIRRDDTEIPVTIRYESGVIEGREYRVVVAAPIGPEESPTAESEIPRWMNEAVSTLPLSDRERDIVVELLKGKTRGEIGATLFISPETVKWHIRRVYRKLGVATKIGLVQRVLAETQVQGEYHD